MMANVTQDPTQVHCYTNPSFCRQSEYIPEDGNNSGSNNDLPPPPQFQIEDLPPPPAVIHTPQPQYGQSNLAFHSSPEHPDIQNNSHITPSHHRSVANNLNRTIAGDRYCYIDDDIDAPELPPVSHKRCGSLPMGNSRSYALRAASRYEYIQDEPKKQQPQQQQQQPIQQIRHTSRYEYLEQQQLQQRVPPAPTPQITSPAAVQHQMSSSISRNASIRSYRATPETHYSHMTGPEAEVRREAQWHEEDGQTWGTPRRQINTPRGRYMIIPMQDDDGPPILPERNEPTPGSAQRQQQQQVNNSITATQQLHALLTTPRKPRSRSQGDALSPVRSPRGQQPAALHSLGQRGGSFTPGCSPSSTAGHRTMNSPAGHHHQQITPSQTPPRNNNSKGPTTSTPNKEPPSARRCLPLHQAPTDNGHLVRRHLEDSQTYGRLAAQTSSHNGHVNSVAEEAMYVERRKRNDPASVNGSYYQSVESAFIARTAVVPPLSPPNSEANTTLMSGTEKSDRKNAPLILFLVGILTCGLAFYLSYTQGRRYYFDSAFVCGACCTLAGACRSMRRTWTGLGLAGLAALSCAGLLLLAAKSPRTGTPLHDVTAGALCGVSILGAVLALLALIAPKCTFGRHHRVHSWIPGYQP